MTFNGPIITIFSAFSFNTLASPSPYYCFSPFALRTLSCEGNYCREVLSSSTYTPLLYSLLFTLLSMSRSFGDYDCTSTENVFY